MHTSFFLQHLPLNFLWSLYNINYKIIVSKRPLLILLLPIYLLNILKELLFSDFIYFIFRYDQIRDNIKVLQSTSIIIGPSPQQQNKHFYKINFGIWALSIFIGILNLPFIMVTSNGYCLTQGGVISIFIVEILLPIASLIVDVGIMIANGWFLYIINKELKLLHSEGNLSQAVAISIHLTPDTNHSNGTRDGSGAVGLCAAEEGPSINLRASAVAEAVETTGSTAPSAFEYEHMKAVARQSLVDLRSTQLAHLLICIIFLVPSILIELMLMPVALYNNIDEAYHYSFFIIHSLIQFLSAAGPYVKVTLLLTKVPPIRRALPFCNRSLLRCEPFIAFLKWMQIAN